MAWELFKTNGANVRVIVTIYIWSLRNFNLRMLLELKYLQEFKRWTDEWMKKKKSEKGSENEKDC